MAKFRYPALERLKIPSKIVHTNSLIRHLLTIAEAKPFLDEYLGTPQEVKLLRRAKVRAVTSSNQIEGNPLGEAEVTAVLGGKRVAGSPKDILETTNYYTALEYAEKLADDSRDLKLADLFDLQRLITQKLVPPSQCGRARTVPVSIVNSATGKKIQDCPEPHALRDLLEDLWRWQDDTHEANPFIRACAFHFMGVAIHPFVDGNGRTMRLMQHLLLLRSGEHIARFVPSETVILRRRDQYYSSIRESLALGRLGPILEFLIESFALAAKEVVEEGRKLLREKAGKTPGARHRKIIAHAAKLPSFAMQEVVGWLPDVPLRTLERDLASLVQARQLRASGKNKARRYRVVAPKKQSP